MIPLFVEDVDRVFDILSNTNGLSFHTHNLASASCVIYALEGHVVSLGGVCLRPSSNNVVGYIFVIELLRDAISNGVQFLEFRLQSQLAVSQLNGFYHIRYPSIL